MIILFAVPEIIVFFILLIGYGVFSSGIIGTILGIIGLIFNCIVVVVFLSSIYSVFVEQDMEMLPYLLITFIILIAMLVFFIKGKTAQKVDTYSTSSQCPIEEITDGYSFNKLPLASISKNVNINDDAIISTGGRSSIKRRVYKCYKYLYFETAEEDVEVWADNEKVEGEFVRSVSYGAFTRQASLYKYDILNCEYIKIKYTGKDNFAARNIKLYNNYDED